MPTIDLTRPALCLAVSAALTGGLPPSAAHAAPVMSYGETNVQLQALARLDGSSTAIDMPPVDLPGNGRDRAELFLTPGVVEGPNWYWAGFAGGTPTHHPDQAYAAAWMDGRGYANMGVSGRTEGPTADSWGALNSSILARQRVTNTGGDGVIKLDYTIPLIEIAQYGNRFDGRVATVAAWLTIERFDSSGHFVKELRGFDYTLTFDYLKPPTDYAIETYAMSDDLRLDSGGLVDAPCVRAEPCTGRSIESFSVSRTLGELDAGDYLLYRYYMYTEFVTGREGGGHAFYGDPLAFSGGGDRNFFVFSSVDGPPGGVPATGTWALSAIGLAALARRRRQTRITSCG